MFGIGGFELIFIIFIALMLFGSDKIPDIARALGKTMKQIKYATNDIKAEIQKSAEANGIDKDSITGGISKEIENIKSQFTDVTKLDEINPTQDLTESAQKIQQDIEELTGPIKRQM